uniref:receptor protein kinase-like protein At4g34220 n=1 Tax=Erigeron canadensis TaxID=72917 RepID=UPI001CB92BDD|nr:receptor protein kinase-like protein At4g34220 [Erigeron canadensis]
MRHKIDTNSNHLIMITTSLFLHFIFSISILISSIYALNQDGTTLLSFKQNLLSYPPSVFQTWNHTQPTPCSWSGVTCAPQTGSVIRLDLPNSRLTGSISNDIISRLEHLRVLDLSNNSINGTLPISLFNISNLETLALSYNFISGELPEMFNNMFHNIRVLNLSHNYLSGRVSSGFDTIEVLDLSYNFFNQKLPLDFGGFSLNYLNLSHNKVIGSLSPEFASKIPEIAIVDLSYNNFSGQIPQTLSNMKSEYFDGNLNLCGKPLKKMCTVPSSHSLPPNVSLEYPSTAAIAAIPKTSEKSNDRGHGKVDIGKVVAIVVGDAAAVALFVVLIFYAYRIRKKKMNQNMKESMPVKIGESTSTYSPVHSRCCFIGGIEEETSEASTEYESVGNIYDNNNNNKCLVLVDGETELEMETLLKASAYILGSSSGSIVYKAVVKSGGDGGVAFAVRRMSKCGGVEKMVEFEKIVRVLGKIRHPNLVKVRGFYWGEEEKLLICDYVSGGSLAGSAAYKKASSTSSCHFSFEVRLKIAKGIAKGLLYIHEKKHVHGNIKPSNILLTSEMDALISDFGLEWLVSGQKSDITDKSTRNFGSKSAITSSINNDNTTYVTPSTSLHKWTSPYQAPESTKTLKPNPKWDVYSFGVILIELFSGKMLSTRELAHWNTDLSISNNETKILEIIDAFTTVDVHKHKDCLLMCFKLGFNCASSAPQKRPSMKEALQVLEKIPSPS